MKIFNSYAKTLASSVWMNTVAGRGQFKALKQRTAMVYPNSLPRDVCEELVSRIDSILEVDKHPRTWRDSLDSDMRILSFEQDIPDLIEHFDIEHKVRAINAYLGLKTKSWLLMANRVVPKPNNLGSGGGLHRDSPFSHQLKCIWYLSDVTAVTGPFCYLPGSHLNILERRATYPLGEMRFDEVQDDLVEVRAEAGSLLVCDTKCIHGGKPIEKGKRYAVTLYTFIRSGGKEAIYRKSGLDPRFSERSDLVI